MEVSGWLTSSLTRGQVYHLSRSSLCLCPKRRGEGVAPTPWVPLERASLNHCFTWRRKQSHLPKRCFLKKKHWMTDKVQNQDLTLMYKWPKLCVGRLQSSYTISAERWQLREGRFILKWWGGGVLVAVFRDQILPPSLGWRLLWWGHSLLLLLFRAGIRLYVSMIRGKVTDHPELLRGLLMCRFILRFFHDHIYSLFVISICYWQFKQSL
jgi:hypothetical protein